MTRTFLTVITFFTFDNLVAARERERETGARKKKTTAREQSEKEKKKTLFSVRKKEAKVLAADYNTERTQEATREKEKKFSKRL